MDRRAKFLEALRSLQTPAPVQVWQAVVKSIEGNNCTVDIVGTDLVDVPDINLRADDEADEGVLIVPRVGSLVYVGAVENATDNLFVCMVSEVDRIEWTIGKTSVKADKDQVTAVRDTVSLTLADVATLKQDQTQISLANGKVTVKNSSVNLKDLFTGLTDLLQNFSVITPVQGIPTPSVSVAPGSLASVTQLVTKVNSLLA